MKSLIIGLIIGATTSLAFASTCDTRCWRDAYGNTRCQTRCY